MGIKSRGIQIETHVNEPQIAQNFDKLITYLICSVNSNMISSEKRVWYCMNDSALQRLPHFSQLPHKMTCASLHVHVFAQKMASTVILYYVSLIKWFHMVIPVLLWLHQIALASHFHKKQMGRIINEVSDCFGSGMMHSTLVFTFNGHRHSTSIINKTLPLMARALHKPINAFCCCCCLLYSWSILRTFTNIHF